MKQHYMIVVGILLSLLAWGPPTDAQTRYTIGKNWIQAQNYDSLVTQYARSDTIFLDRTNRDVSLYRSAANVLYSPDTLSVGGDLRASGKIRVSGTADSLKSTRVWADSLILDITNRDVKLYRSAANILYTPDTLSVGGRVYLADDQWIGLGAAAGRIEFDDQATDEVNILNANVGIGTTSPTHKLEVNGTIKTYGQNTVHATSALILSQDSNTKSQIRAYGADGTTAGTLEFVVSSNDGIPSLAAMTIDSVGNVGIGAKGFGTNAVRVLACSLGTAPTTALTNAGQMWVDDYAAGDARWYFMGEGSTNTVIIGNGKVEVSAGLTVGTSATEIDTILSATRTIDFPSVAADAEVDSTITVSGALAGDAVWLGLPAAPIAGGIFQSFVSAANTVTIRFRNVTAGALDPGSATYRVAIVNF